MDNLDNKTVYFSKTIWYQEDMEKYCLRQEYSWGHEEEEDQYSSSSSGSLRIPNIFPTDLTLLITCKSITWITADGGDDEDLLLDKVEAHGNHGDAKEEIEGAESDPLLPVLHLLIRGQVPEANGCQSDEAKVGTEKM